MNLGTLCLSKWSGDEEDMDRLPDDVSTLYEQ